MMERTLNVAMIGGGFMGKAHSNAWRKVNTFFNAPFKVNLKVIVGNHSPLESLAENWGYDEVSYDWREVVRRPDIDIVDIGVPTDMHAEIAIEAARNGKHVVCEKPCAMDYGQCAAMAEAAEQNNVVHYLNHNYRRVPAIALAKHLIDTGRIGKIYHWRGAYLQDWIMDSDAPRTWHLQRARAGGGSSFDLGSHAIDLARFLVGDPVAVTARFATFIDQRPVPSAGAATFSKGEKPADTRLLPVDVDDAAFMLLEFANGALGSVEVSRFAGGRKNYNDFELYGSKGCLKFNFERMNELQFSDLTLPLEEQGFRTILVTEQVHPYISAWWPVGHIIGYEHTFVNAFNDFLCAIEKGSGITPNFRDGAACIQVIQAAERSNATGRRVLVSEIQ